jgi:hypothetical protein
MVCLQFCVLYPYWLDFNVVLGSRLALLIEWINAVLPNFNLPLETSEEELRECLRDGSVLCSILDKLVPGSLEVVGYCLLFSNWAEIKLELFSLYYYFSLSSEEYIFNFREAVLWMSRWMLKGFWWPWMNLDCQDLKFQT